MDSEVAYRIEEGHLNLSYNSSKQCVNGLLPTFISKVIDKETFGGLPRVSKRASYRHLSMSCERRLQGASSGVYLGQSVTIVSPQCVMVSKKRWRSIGSLLLEEGLD